MYTCQFCNKNIESIKKFASHLSHPKSPCKTNIKDYYDKYLRKEDEGYCEFCRRETSFSSLSKGYQNRTCKYCKNKSQSSKLKRQNTESKKSEERKIKNGYYNLPEICEICNKRFKNRAGLSRHVLNLHKIKPKDYYDRYLKKDNEGICPVTNKKTKFKNMTEGYFKYYGKGIGSKDPNIKKKIIGSTENNKFNNPEKYDKSKQVRINKFKETYRKRRELQQQRERLIDTLRVLTVDKTDKQQCQICGKSFLDLNKLILHLRSHKIPIKEYYDKFFKEKNEDICEICNYKTKFQSFRIGYSKYCRYCAGKSFEATNASKQASTNYLREKCIRTENEYNVTIIDKSKINKVTDKIDIKCNFCNKTYINSLCNLWLGYAKCPNCFKQPERSSYEIYLYNLIKENYEDLEVINNCRELIKNPNTGRNLEIDIYVPEKKLGIEINGLYWHSELIQKDPINYHYLKYSESNKNGILLLQFFEDELFFKSDIIKSIIKKNINFIKKEIPEYYIIREISTRLKNNFLYKNHIKGYDNSLVNLGCFYENELLSVMTFKNTNNSSWILNRFCNKLNSNYDFSNHIIKHFIGKYKPSNFYTYIDLRLDSKDYYKKMGFSNQIKYIEPESFYVSNGFSRIKEKIENSYKIWDAGKIKLSF